MLKKLLTPVCFLFLFIACHQPTKKEIPQVQTPKALAPKTDSYEFVSKRGYDDLVDNLYAELVAKDVSLQELENNIKTIKASKNDSTSQFEEFDQKNQAYFTAANNHLAQIQDSSLKLKIKAMITANQNRYNSSIARYKDFLKTISAKQLTIEDLHEILKIVKTLPLIENYQQASLPNPASFEGYILQQEEIIKKTNTYINK